MTKETAIDILKSQKNEHYKEEINEALDMAISALKGGWIPVKEKLPEEGKSVLVCLRTQGGMAQYVSERMKVTGEWMWTALGGRKPLAWRPLPEPYKKGE